MDEYEYRIRALVLNADTGALENRESVVNAVNDYDASVQADLLFPNCAMMSIIGGPPPPTAPEKSSQNTWGPFYAYVDEKQASGEFWKGVMGCVVIAALLLFFNY